jgi:hypothetical protein
MATNTRLHTIIDAAHTNAYTLTLYMSSTASSPQPTNSKPQMLMNLCDQRLLEKAYVAGKGHA